MSIRSGRWEYIEAEARLGGQRWETRPMSDQAVEHQHGELPLTTLLALDRTRIAYERTLMAWVRTGTSLITFGFAVHKFFQFEVAGATPRAVLIKTTILGPREFGLALIGIGLLSLRLCSGLMLRSLADTRFVISGMPRRLNILRHLLGSWGISARPSTKRSSRR